MTVSEMLNAYWFSGAPVHRTDSLKDAHRLYKSSKIRGSIPSLKGPVTPGLGTLMERGQARYGML
ncbi:MAG TPA: hypothetical protein HA366_04520 [Candidatus Methanomethylophilaceae archaeon]|nr:hypothetical protein [Candidatus Methanomethylophilaceae archaeon]